MPSPSDWREALQWFVNTLGLYSGSTRGLFLSDWNEEQAVSMEAAVINLKSRNFSPFVVSGETVYQQAEFLFEESREKVTFGRPLASKVELELSGNDVVIVDALEAPQKPSQIWYLLYYLLFPRAISGKVTIFTTPLPYAEFVRYGQACPDFDYCGKPLNWEKLLFLIESCTINQELFKLAREESIPPMLKAEFLLYTALRDRGMEPFPQHVLGDYLLDFALMQGSRRLNIECDLLSPLSGHEINTREAKRDFVLLSDGWQILKFSSSELINNTSACADVVEDSWREGRKRSRCGRLLTGESLPPAPDLPADDVQRSAIVFGGGPLALVGGSGTGKSVCLQQRVAYLLAQGISPDNILVLSYSADTARVLKQGMELITDKALVQRLNVCSFHELGMKILKENLPAIKRKPPLKLEPTPQKVIQKLLTKARKDVDAVKLEMSGDLDEFYVAAMISMYKAHLVSAKTAKAEAEGESELLVAKVYQAYEDQLQKTNRIDKHDVFALSVQVLLENQELRTKYQSAYEFILVDEYQELTVAQDMLARILAAPQDNLFLCGDEDETISENQNACPELLSAFSQRFPNGRSIVMEHNWRCHPSIVEHAKWVLSYLERSKIKKGFDSGWGAVPTQAIFGPQPCIDEAEEAAWTARQIKALVEAGRDAGDIAVIYRQNQYENMLEEELLACGVRFRASVSDNSLIPDELGDMLSFLKLVMDPDGPRARESFERVCQLGTKEIDPKLSATIDSFAGANNLSYLKAVEIYAEATADQSCKELEQLVRVIRAMNNDRLPPAESIGYLRRTRRLNDYYKNIKVPPGQVYEPLKKLSRMEEEARKFATVVDFVQHVEERLGDYDDSTEEAAVHVKSILDVKGFEFPIVFFVGLADGLNPLANSPDLEEERRQFYVAFTRAREAIYLSYPVRSAGKDLGPSRFLAEARLVPNIPMQLAPASKAASTPAVAEAPAVAPPPPVVTPLPAVQTEAVPAAPAMPPQHVVPVQSYAPLQAPVPAQPLIPEPIEPEEPVPPPQQLSQQPATEEPNVPLSARVQQSHTEYTSSPYYANPQELVPQQPVQPPAPPPEPQAPVQPEMPLAPPEPAIPLVDHFADNTIPEKPMGLSPYVDNPEPAEGRGMKKLPPSRGQHKAAEPVPEPKPEPKPDYVRPDMFSPVPPGPPSVGQRPLPRAQSAADAGFYQGPGPQAPGVTGAASPPEVPLQAPPQQQLPQQEAHPHPQSHQHEYKAGVDISALHALRGESAYLDPMLHSHQEHAPAPIAAGCPSCANPLEANARFCGECGFSLPEPPTASTRCVVCGVSLEPLAKFCGECGTPAAPAAPAAQEQGTDEEKKKGGMLVKFLKFLEN